MGSGECSVIVLLHLLEHMRSGGLIVIEELEAGLHPEAQARLAQLLISISKRRQIQVICSTHSPVVLDSVPRQARLLLRQAGGQCEIFESPSTRFAMYEMTGSVHPELMIYCEDVAAAALIREALEYDVRRRVTIQEIGGSATVARQGVSHARSGNPLACICVFDGDCTKNQVEEWLGSESGGHGDLHPNYIILPGEGDSPERWVIEQLRLPAYRMELANQLLCSEQETEAHIQALGVALDEHDIDLILSRRTGLDHDDCLRRIMRSVAQHHPQLDELRVAIAQTLD